MDPRHNLYKIIFSPLILFFHNTLHLSPFWLLFIVMILLNIYVWRSPKGKGKIKTKHGLNINNLIEKISIVIVKILSLAMCFICLYGAITDPFDKGDKGHGAWRMVYEDIQISKKTFLIYCIVSALGAYKVFYSGILLPCKKKKAGDKKSKIDIMSVVYFAMLSVFAITSLFIVLGVIKT